MLTKLKSIKFIKLLIAFVVFASITPDLFARGGGRGGGRGGRGGGGARHGGARRGGGGARAHRGGSRGARRQGARRSGQRHPGRGHGRGRHFVSGAGFRGGWGFGTGWWGWRAYGVGAAALGFALVTTALYGNAWFNAATGVTIYYDGGRGVWVNDETQQTYANPPFDRDENLVEEDEDEDGYESGYESDDE